MSDGDFENSKIRDEYNRWLGSVGEDQYPAQDCVGIHEVLRAHYTILDYFRAGDGVGVGGSGPRDINLLHSAVSRQQVTFGGVAKYQDKFSTVATLFFGLIQNHPFHDANKRTALLVALHHLLRIGRVPTVGHKELEKLALRTAAHELDQYKTFEKFAGDPDCEIAFLAAYLRRITREQDVRNYAITFQQLDTLLRKFGFQLDHPSGNHIDVVQFREERKLFGLQKKMVRHLICQVGFPGWKVQVGAAALRTIRRETGLTHADGCDAQVFFRGADRLSSLVAQYDGPLRRLANK